MIEWILIILKFIFLALCGFSSLTMYQDGEMLKAIYFLLMFMILER